jgi:phenylacetic acid degradation operon negative regulatory protein
MTTTQLINTSLKLIGENGFSGSAISASNAQAALEKLTDLSHHFSQKALHELRRQQLIATSREGGKIRFQLTTKGLHRLQRLKMKELAVPEPKKWDGHWRVVMFDVPTRHNRRRTNFTRILKQMGFTMLRDSVWVYPHPCFDQLDEVTAFCGLQQFVTYAEINRLDNGSTARLLRHYPALTA